MIIGLTGGPRTGKSAAADFLVLHHRFLAIEVCDSEPHRARITERRLCDFPECHIVFSNVLDADSADVIRARGGVIVRIERPQAAHEMASPCASDVPLSDGDRVIHNNGSVFQLYDQLDYLINSLILDRACA